MRQDARDHRPFKNNFPVTVLKKVITEAAAQIYEERYIDQFKTTGPMGYNKLKGAPGRSKQFWFLKGRKKI